MPYASQADIDARYPGALNQAGPKDADGELDAAAVTLALGYADGLIDQSLAQAALVYTAPYPAWLTDLAVDIALYRATPAPQAGDAAFKDRRDRYEDAMSRLHAIATRAVPPPSDPPPPASAASAATAAVVVSSQARRRWGGR